VGLTSGEPGPAPTQARWYHLPNLLWARNQQTVSTTLKIHAVGWIVPGTHLRVQAPTPGHPRFRKPAADYGCIASGRLLGREAIGSRPCCYPTHRLLSPWLIWPRGVPAPDARRLPRRVSCHSQFAASNAAFAHTTAR